MNKIQQLIDAGGAKITLPPGEYKGPFYINNPCVIEGANTTLWNDSETVLFIKSDGVTINNVRIELVNSSEKSDVYSICADFRATYKDVEVIGKTKGLGMEDSIPEMQRQLRIGKFLCETENTFLFEVYSPDAMSILTTDIKDISIEPVNLTAGINKIRITVSPISSGSFVYGDIILKTKLNRRFFLSGSAMDNCEKCSDKCISAFSQSELAEIQRSKLVNMNAVSESTVKSSYNVQHINNQNNSVQKNTPTKHSSPEIVGTYHLKRGERVYIDNISENVIKVKMGYRGLFKDLEIDPYVFMLDSTGITSCDDDFIYFGNTDSKCGGIIFNEDKTFDIDLGKIPSHIERISFVYSIYHPDSKDNFSKVMDPFISLIWQGKEIYKYTATELFAETTIIFLDIYRYNSRWKLNTIGQGYREGLKKLCSSYGLIVS